MYTTICHSPPKGAPRRGILPANHRSITFRSRLRHLTMQFCFKALDPLLCVCVYIYIYIYIHIYIYIYMRIYIYMYKGNPLFGSPFRISLWGTVNVRRKPTPQKTLEE